MVFPAQTEEVVGNNYGNRRKGGQLYLKFTVMVLSSQLPKMTALLRGIVFEDGFVNRGDKAVSGRSVLQVCLNSD